MFTNKYEGTKQIAGCLRTDNENIRFEDLSQNMHMNFKISSGHTIFNKNKI